MHVLLKPDRGQIERFVEAIFKHAGHDGFISIRSFGQGNVPFHIGAVALTEGLDAVVEVAVNAARHAARHSGPVTFCPPLSVLNNRYHARAEDLLRGLVLTAECDKYPLEARRQLEAFLGPATVVVASGGEWIGPDGEIEPKLHLHWRLKQPTVTVEGHALLLEARRSIIMLVDCDPTNAPISHPIRWPGSWHRKGHPKLASLVSVTDHEIDLNAVLTVLRGLVRTVSERRAANSPRLVAERPEEVAAILDYLPNLGGEGRGEANYDRTRGWYHWNDICLMTYAATQGSELGRRAFHKWSAKSGLYNELTTERKWRSYHRSPPNRKGFGSLVYVAWQYYISTLEQPPDWLKAEMEKDRGKGASTHPSDNRFGRGK